MFSSFPWRGLRIDHTEDLLRTDSTTTDYIWQLPTSVMGVSFDKCAKYGSKERARHPPFLIPTEGLNSNWTLDVRKKKYMYILHRLSGKNLFFSVQYRSKRTPSLHQWHCNRHSNAYAKLSTLPYITDMYMTAVFFCSAHKHGLLTCLSLRD